MMATYFTAQFTGGMNELLDPALLDEKTASLLVNADCESGKLVSVRMPNPVPVNTPEELDHYGKVNRSVVKLYDRTYWSINDTLTAPFYGGDKENYLGIPFPDYEKDVVITPQENGELTGNFKYCVTFVNENGWESAPGAVLDYERAVILEEKVEPLRILRLRACSAICGNLVLGLDTVDYPVAVIAYLNSRRYAGITLFTLYTLLALFALYTLLTLFTLRALLIFAARS